MGVAVNSLSSARWTADIVPLRNVPWQAGQMRRSIDDYPFDPSDIPAGADDAAQLSWAVAISDDYDDAEPRVVLTLEEVGHPGEGLVAHLSAAMARRLRAAINDALREVGHDPGR
ncbi:unannotated protein [freshwater metagenome]|uniref:Unannotated protein n=1 Tax=freshwater metagenome TaxID=449393 RepID=A0A6J7EIZ3_9ZZZZ